MCEYRQPFSWNKSIEHIDHCDNRGERGGGENQETDLIRRVGDSYGGYLNIILTRGTPYQSERSGEEKAIAVNLNLFPARNLSFRHLERLLLQSSFYDSCDRRSVRFS